MKGFWLLVLCCFSAATAQAEWGGESTTLGWQGANSQGQQKASVLQRLRLKGDGGSGALNWQLQYDVTALAGGAVRDPLFFLQKQQPPATYARVEGTLLDRSPWYIRHQLYRGWLQYRHRDWQFTAGRQRVAWGTGRFWNPTDRFNPVLPTALEPNEKTGVDALSLRWNYSGFGSVQSVLAPARLRYGIPRKLAVRWQDTWDFGDLSLLWERVGSEDYAGMDFAGNLGDAGVRFEAMQGLRNQSLQWVAGVDYTLTSSWFEQGLYLAAEYFYNAKPTLGATVAAPAAQGLVTRSHQLLGLNAGYDLTPLWRLDCTWIQDLEQSSAAVLPGLTWSWMQNVDVTLATQWFTGRRGEFAGLNTIGSLKLRWYF